MKRIAASLFAVSVACSSFAQSIQFAASWDPKNGFEPKLIWAETPWKIEKAFGSFDVQPFFWGSILDGRGGGGGFYARVPFAQNASLLAGPIVRFYSGERPTVGVMLGVSVRLGR